MLTDTVKFILGSIYIDTNKMQPCGTPKLNIEYERLFKTADRPGCGQFGASARNIALQFWEAARHGIEYKIVMVKGILADVGRAG